MPPVRCMLHHGLVAGFLAAFAGCTSPTAPTSMAGSWESQLCRERTPGGCFTLTLTQAGDTIVGTGQLNGGTFDINGLYARPQLSLTLILEGGSTVVSKFTGRALNSTEMDLTYVGTSETIRFYKD